MPFYVGYECTNDECDEVTTVTEWPATRWDPADSTHGDGCSNCGEALQDEPVDDFDPDREP